MGTLDGQVAWITGGGTGIGRAGAVELARAGAIVVLSGRRPEMLEDAARTVREFGGEAEAMRLDVADRAAVAETAAAILDRFGRIDILVNSAGTNVPRRSWAEVDPEGWDQVHAVNANGTYYCIAAVLPAMRARRAGLVINIASWAGRRVGRIAGPAYTAAKHAVVALTESLNMEECVNGIRACAICPGEVDTPILDARPEPIPPEVRARMLQAEDLGRTIRFVAEMPHHVCINEILISPTWNRSFIGR